MTAIRMRRHAFRFISSKRICYILFIECINSPSNCSLCSQMCRDVSIIISLIFDSSLWNTLLFEMSQRVAGGRSCRACFLPSLHKTYSQCCTIGKLFVCATIRDEFEIWTSSFILFVCVWCALLKLTSIN